MRKPFVEITFIVSSKERLEMKCKTFSEFLLAKSDKAFCENIHSKKTRRKHIGAVSIPKVKKHSGVFCFSRELSAGDRILEMSGDM